MNHDITYECGYGYKSSYRNFHLQLYVYSFKHVIVFLCLEQFQKCSCPLRSIEIYMVFTLPAQ